VGRIHRGMGGGKGMTSKFFEDLQAMTEARETALGIVADMGTMDIQNKITVEAYYTSKGPYLMLIEVEGKECTVCNVSPFTCVQRANDLYGDDWKEISFEKQTEFMEKFK